MPVNEEGIYTFPGVNGSKVGERLFYINEDPMDAAPTLRQILKVRAAFNGIPRQEVFPGSKYENLQGYDWTPFFSTAEEARDEYIVSAKHSLAQKYDPNRPGDISQRKDIQTNLDRLLALDWEKAVTEARTALETVLAETRWGKMPIPVQEHLIGDIITSDYGHKEQVAEAELVDEDGEIGIGLAQSLRVIYKDNRGRTIKLSPKTV